MKVKVLHKFHDRVDFSKVYLVGETYTFDDARAESLIARGLVESDEEAAEKILEDEAPIEETLVAETAEEAVEVEGEATIEAEEAIEEEAEKAPIKAVKPVATKRKNQPKDN